MRNTEQAEFIHALAIKQLKAEIEQHHKEIDKLRDRPFYWAFPSWQDRVEFLRSLIQVRESHLAMVQKREARLGEGARKRLRRTA